MGLISLLECRILAHLHGQNLVSVAYVSTLVTLGKSLPVSVPLFLHL